MHGRGTLSSPPHDIRPGDLPTSPPVLLTSGGHHWGCVQTCLLPLPVLTSIGGHRNTYGWQAGGSHPTGMLSCYHPQQSCEGYVFIGVCLSTGGSAPGGICFLRGVCSGGMSAPGGVSAPRGSAPREGVCSRGVSALPPRERRLLLRTVRILLECILVGKWFSWVKFILELTSFLHFVYQLPTFLSPFCPYIRATT